MHREDSRHVFRSPHQSLVNGYSAHVWLELHEGRKRTLGENSCRGAVVQLIPGAHTKWGGVRAPTAQVEALLNTESVTPSQ